MQVLFLKYPGVQGEVTIAAFRGLVACTSFSMSAELGESGETGYGDPFGGEEDPFAAFESSQGGGGGGGGYDRNQKIMGLTNVSISRTVDKATPKFFKLAFADKEELGGGETATLFLCRAFERDDALGLGGIQFKASLDKGVSMTTGAIQWHEPFVKVTLKDSHITSHSITLGTDSLEESFTIGFKEVTLEYIVFKNGKRMGNVVGHVDVASRD